MGGERGEFRSGKDLSDPILIRSSGISQPRWIGRKQLQRSLTRCQIKHVLSAKIFFLCIFKMYFALFLVYNHIPIILDCLQFIFGWLAYINPSLKRKTSTIMRIHIRCTLDLRLYLRIHGCSLDSWLYFRFVAGLKIHGCTLDTWLDLRYMAVLYPYK